MTHGETNRQRQLRNGWKVLLSIGMAGALAFSLSGCWVGSDPKSCVKISEDKGEALARKSLKRFLEYTGKTHSPLSGPAGTLNPVLLEQFKESDLVYDGRSPDNDHVYNFHLSWAPQAKFTSTLAGDCGTTNNWTIE